MADRPNPFGPDLGYDPAKPPEKKKLLNTRVELPADAARLQYNFPFELPLRPGKNTAGKQVQVRVNQFKVSKLPDRDVWQYDVLIGNGAEKKGKMTAVWKSKTVQAKLNSFKVPWLWNGDKIAWTSAKIPEMRIALNFDQEKGRQPRPGREPDIVYCHIKPTKSIRMAVIKAYLDKQMPFDNVILEAINFLDHLMRQYPSENFTSIKRNFYTRGGNGAVPLDSSIIGLKGVYSSIRLCSPFPTNGGQSTGVAINVDVANGTFWTAQRLHQAARNFLKDHNRQADYAVFGRLISPIKDRAGHWTWSDDFKTLRKMAKLRFTCSHRGKLDDEKVYTIKRFTFAPKEGGAHAKNTLFKWRNRETNTEEEISVYDYFRRHYNLTLKYWDFPLVETERNGFFPMEVCDLMPNQRYAFKLSPDQTAAMIKFAVTRPKERIKSIQNGIDMLKWNQDPYMRHFGFAVEPNMTLTNARLLQPPEVQYLGSKVSPGTTGRWDLRGKKFLLPNDEPLNSWGFFIVNGCLPDNVVRNFANVFIQTYLGHGGKIQNKNPVIYRHAKGDDLPPSITAFRSQVGNQVKAIPQILFYIMPGRDSWLYERIKRNTECRWGIVSQCLNLGHVTKASPQYASNVCMKVNAKLGGTTCKVVNPQPTFKKRTLILGADVSHPGAGSPTASMAAITVSFDQNACRFAAAVQTNGFRVEMITANNIRIMLIPMIQKWVANPRAGGGSPPEHIYYFRDGVSEGQYSQVLHQEVKDMKEAMVAAFGAKAGEIPWTVAVCTKRHHIRFLPREGDKLVGDHNGNPLPGTLVESDVTHPFEYDFYLNAHSAIQGTARPVHYHVLKDEAGVDVNEFQKMIYQFSYQYMRSTTPVSLFPAIYYAHLASNRARAHEAKPASLGPLGGQKGEERRQDAAVAANRMRGTQDSSSQTNMSDLEVLPLVPLGNPDGGYDLNKLRCGMWYI